jgi:hypothetical protein
MIGLPDRPTPLQKRKRISWAQLLKKLFDCSNGNDWAGGDVDYRLPD